MVHAPRQTALQFVHASIKRGWKEMPGLMLGGALAAAVAPVIYASQSFTSFIKDEYEGAYDFECKHGDHSVVKMGFDVMYQDPEKINYRYRHHLEIVRPDDPRLLRVRKYDNSPAITVTPPGFVPTVMEEGHDWTFK